MAFFVHQSCTIHLNLKEPTGQLQLLHGAGLCCTSRSQLSQQRPSNKEQKWCQSNRRGDHMETFLKTSLPINPIRLALFSPQLSAEKSIWKHFNNFAVRAAHQDSTHGSKSGYSKPGYKQTGNAQSQKNDMQGEGAVPGISINGKLGNDSNRFFEEAHFLEAELQKEVDHPVQALYVLQVVTNRKDKSELSEPNAGIHVALFGDGRQKVLIQRIGRRVKGKDEEAEEHLHESDVIHTNIELDYMFRTGKLTLLDDKSADTEPANGQVTCGNPVGEAGPAVKDSANGQAAGGTSRLDPEAEQTESTNGQVTGGTENSMEKKLVGSMVAQGKFLGNSDCVLERGSVDEVYMIGPHMNHVDAMWLAPEAGTWRPTMARLLVVPIPSTTPSLDNDIALNNKPPETGSALGSNQDEMPEASSDSGPLQDKTSTKQSDSGSLAKDTLTKSAGTGLLEKENAEVSSDAGASSHVTQSQAATEAGPESQTLTGTAYIFKNREWLLLGDSTDHPALELDSKLVQEDIPIPLPSPPELFRSGSQVTVAYESAKHIAQVGLSLLANHVPGMGSDLSLFNTEKGERKEESMREYKELKDFLLKTTGLLVSTGAAGAYFIGGLNTAQAFGLGGLASLLYLLHLQNTVDQIAVTSANPVTSFLGEKGEGPNADTAKGWTGRKDKAEAEVDVSVDDVIIALNLDDKFGTIKKRNIGRGADAGLGDSQGIEIGSEQVREDPLEFKEEVVGPNSGPKQDRWSISRVSTILSDVIFLELLKRRKGSMLSEWANGHVDAQYFLDVEECLSVVRSMAPLKGVLPRSFGKRLEEKEVLFGEILDLRAEYAMVKESIEEDERRNEEAKASMRYLEPWIASVCADDPDTRKSSLLLYGDKIRSWSKAKARSRKKSARNTNRVYEQTNDENPVKLYFDSRVEEIKKESAKVESFLDENKRLNCAQEVGLAMLILEVPKQFTEWRANWCEFQQWGFGAEVLAAAKPLSRFAFAAGVVLVLSKMTRGVGAGLPPSDLCAGFLGFLTYKIAIVMAAVQTSTPLNSEVSGFGKESDSSEESD